MDDNIPDLGNMNYYSQTNFTCSDDNLDNTMPLLKSYSKAELFSL